MKSLRINAVVSQSGGPTSVINATLSGVIRACMRHSDRVGVLYGARNGIDGLLREDLVNLSSFFGTGTHSLSLLEHTPSCALGSCRSYLPSGDDADVYKRIFYVLDKYSVGYFFYIGGNDSMDTVDKLHRYSEMTGRGIRFIGIPKTVDNDLCMTDHSPGYGSAVKLVTNAVEEIMRDSEAYTKDSVTVVEIMGRDTGWLTLSASLCGINNGRTADMIIVPEHHFDDDTFTGAVRAALQSRRDIVIAVSEGIRYPDGSYVCQGKRTDSFGHRYLSGVSRYLAGLIDEQIGCKTRAIELNVLQRCSAHIASRTDIDESIDAGYSAVRMALDGYSGKMVTLQRKRGEYRSYIGMCDLDRVAGRVKYVPSELLCGFGKVNTKKCREYLLPLIEGERDAIYSNGLLVHCILDRKEYRNV